MPFCSLTLSQNIAQILATKISVILVEFWMKDSSLTDCRNAILINTDQVISSGVLNLYIEDQIQNKTLACMVLYLILFWL